VRAEKEKLKDEEYWKEGGTGTERWRLWVWASSEKRGENSDERVWNWAGSQGVMMMEGLDPTLGGG
jgi:hypothetical protein